MDRPIIWVWFILSLFVIFNKIFVSFLLLLFTFEAAAFPFSRSTINTARARSFALPATPHIQALGFTLSKVVYSTLICEQELKVMH